MQKFKDILETLEDASHIKKIEFYDKDKTLVGKIENKPGSLGSIKVYHHLWRVFGQLNLDAAVEGLDLYSEHTEDAQNHPGKHPNIDRLLDIIETEEVFSIKLKK